MFGWLVQYLVFWLFLFLSNPRAICSLSFNSSSSSPAKHLCSTTDGLALLHFKNCFSITDGYYAGCPHPSSPKTESWKENSDCCSWVGVTCDKLTGRVIGLDLNCERLAGSIHDNSSLFLLDHLQSLNLAYNNFSHSRISSKFGGFSDLTNLNLSSAIFSGPVPYEISHLSNLISLDLSYYGFSLDQLCFDMLLRNLTQLRHLNLDNLDMSSIVPRSLMNVSSSLISLSLRYCSLKGNFPNEVFHLPHLRDLTLSSNKDLIVDFSKSNWISPLKILDLSNLGFTGNLPEIIVDLRCLEELDLGNNYFSGQIPASLSKLERLTSLRLHDNEFSGQFPNIFLNLTNLIHLDISYNHFSGQLPSSLFNLTKVSEIWSYGNQFSGQLPSHVSGLQNLNQLGLASNNINGDLPPWLFVLPFLSVLELSGNKLTGPIEFQHNNNSLSQVYLSSNEFYGPVPDSLFELARLLVLDLSSNKLSGIIKPHLFAKPDNLWSCSFSNNVALSFVDTANANFTLPNLKYFECSSCNLTDIPRFLRAAKDLESLDLANNNINGNLPPWLFVLPFLSVLELSGNKLTGPIEFQHNNNSLRKVDLSSNEFYGPVPDSLFELARLLLLDLSSNKLSGIIKPHLFAKPDNLVICSFSNNAGFSFVDTANVKFTLPNLKYFECSSCNLTDIPRFLRAAKYLESLDLSNNNIYGKVSLAQSLNYLNLSQNYITGIDINSSILDLHSNMLHGPLMAPHHPHIYFFAVSHNKFTGEIPSSFCSLGNDIAFLDLSNNSLSGTIPQCLGNYGSLEFLNLRMNNFSGSIPLSFTKDSSLTSLYLNNNHLEGPLPPSLVNCKMLEVLDVGNNMISETFPHWLAELPELQVLVLRSNRFYGFIGSFQTTSPFPKLQIIDISYNEFTGPLPTTLFEYFNARNHGDSNIRGPQYMEHIFDIFSGILSYPDSVILTRKGISIEMERILTTFSTIDLSNNRFRGSIPEVGGNLKSLIMFNLSHNSLTGNIPSSFGNLTALESLDLSSNQLVGKIPLRLANLKYLAMLNLSNNNLEGPIPKGSQFQTFDNISFIGNSKLCGSPLTKKCENDDTTVSVPSTFNEEEDDTWKWVWRIVMMGYGSGLVVGVSTTYMVFTTGRPFWIIKMYERLRQPWKKVQRPRERQRRGGRS